MKSAAVNTVLLLIVVANAAAQKRPAIATADGIRAYCRDVGAFTTRQETAKLIFAEICPRYSCGGAAQTTWRQLPNAGALEEVRTSGSGDSAAFVWLEHEDLVEANFTFQSESGDWVHYANYCFRPDGSLALLKSTLNTFYGEMSVQRETLFSANGTVLDSSTRYSDLRTREPKKPPAGFRDEIAPIYRSVLELPFLVIVSTGPAIDGPEMGQVVSTTVFYVPAISPERLRTYPPLPEPLPPNTGEEMKHRWLVRRKH